VEARDRGGGRQGFVGNGHGDHHIPYGEALGVSYHGIWACVPRQWQPGGPRSLERSGAGSGDEEELRLLDRFLLLSLSLSQLNSIPISLSIVLSQLGSSCSLMVLSSVLPHVLLHQL
jgi:hypothetical protein